MYLKMSSEKWRPFCLGLNELADHTQTWHKGVASWRKWPTHKPDNACGTDHWHCQSCVTGPWFNIKMSSYQYRESHCGDKTVVRSSCLHNGISYTGKISSLYWIRALVTISEYFFERKGVSQIQLLSILLVLVKLEMKVLETYLNLTWKIII